jgi:geranylgeranyl pyrophosphate synthase
LSDWDGSGDSNDLSNLRPSLLLAIARERANDEVRAYLDRVWRREEPADAVRLATICRETGADERCRQLLETYKEEAIRSLSALENSSLKGLLRRTLGKIFNDVEIKGWCKEHEAANHARSEGELVAAK